MNRLIIGLLIIIILVIIWLYFHNRISQLKNEHFQMKQSMLNNNSYNVKDYPHPDGAADLLAIINRNIKSIIKCLIGKYPNDARVERLKSRAENLQIEEAEHEVDSSTYTINKGELMAICLRKKNTSKDFYNMDLLLFVIIHELAHIMTISEGHTPEFMVNFKFILKEATGCGLYKPVNYASQNTDYCGVMITHNPYFE
jgi:hypothetical protein